MFLELKKTMNRMMTMCYISKETNYKRETNCNSELKNTTMGHMGNSLEWLKSRHELIEERITKL